MGSRRGRFPEAWPRRFCITKLVTVIRLTGGLAGRGSAMWKQVGSQHQHLPGDVCRDSTVPPVTSFVREMELTRTKKNCGSGSGR